MTEQHQTAQNDAGRSQQPEDSAQPLGAPASTPVPGPRPAPPGAPTTSDGPTSDGPTSDGPTGDPQIDAALAELEGASPDDLDAQVEAGGRVHRTLQSRLSDLGGQ